MNVLGPTGGATYYGAPPAEIVDKSGYGMIRELARFWASMMPRGQPIR
jgi:hypothetical protein